MDQVLRSPRVFCAWFGVFALYPLGSEILFWLADLGCRFRGLRAWCVQLLVT